MARPVAKAAKINLEICQGRTFSKTLRYGQPRRIYKQLTGASKTAPCVLTVPDHGMPDGWAFTVSNVKGMTELNSDRVYQATVLDSDLIELNDVNAVDFKPYTGSGIITYQQPVDLAGYTARMQIRPEVSSQEVLLELTTANGRIVLDNVAKAITMQVTAMDTAGIDWDEGVYDLELESAGGKVELLSFGNVTIVYEVTR